MRAYCAQVCSRHDWRLCCVAYVDVHLERRSVSMYRVPPPPIPVAAAAAASNGT